MPVRKAAINSPQLTKLREENARLKDEVKRLREELAFHKRHARGHTAQDGERYLRRLLGGSLSSHNAGHDLVVGRKRFEVKSSECASADNKKALSTLRWTWHKLFGTGGNKSYDRLILLGRVDVRHAAKYADRSAPYVIFDIPAREARQLMSDTSSPFIQVSTNPHGQRTEKGRLLWSYQITRAELRQRYQKK